MDENDEDQPTFTKTTPPHPMQPIVTKDGVYRFNENSILRWAVNTGRLSLNEIAAEAANQGFTDDDQAQLAQLIGYSLGGYAELPYVSDENYDAARNANIERLKNDTP